MIGSSRGESVVVLIEGEAGIGMTRLLDKAVRDARARVGLERWSSPARSAWSQGRLIVPGRLRIRGGPRSGELLATEGASERTTVTSDPGLRFRAVDSFADLAEELALSGPLVIGLDAIEIYERLDVARDLARSEAIMRMAGIRPGWPGNARPTADRLA